MDAVRVGHAHLVQQLVLWQALVALGQRPAVQARLHAAQRLLQALLPRAAHGHDLRNDQSSQGQVGLSARTHGVWGAWGAMPHACIVLVGVADVHRRARQHIQMAVEMAAAGVAAAWGAASGTRQRSFFFGGPGGEHGALAVRRQVRTSPTLFIMVVSSDLEPANFSNAKRGILVTCQCGVANSSRTAACLQKVQRHGQPRDWARSFVPRGGKAHDAKRPVAGNPKNTSKHPLPRSACIVHWRRCDVHGPEGPRRPQPSAFGCVEAAA